MRRWDHDTVRLPWLMTSRHRQCRLKSKLHTEKCDAIHCWIRGMPKQRLCKTGVSMAWLRCEASKLPPREPRRQARQPASYHITGILLGLAKLGPSSTGSHGVGSERIRLSLLTSRSQYSAFCGDEYCSVSVFMRFKSTVCHSCSKELFTASQCCTFSIFSTVKVFLLRIRIDVNC